MGKKRKEVKKKGSRRIEERKRRKKIFYLFAFIIILISIFVAAWYLASRPTSTGTLVIHVVDEDTGNPIGEATIGIDRMGTSAQYGQSNEQGIYIFESIPVGTYTVWAVKDPYHVHPETVTVEAGKTTDHTISLHTHH